MSYANTPMSIPRREMIMPPIDVSLSRFGVQSSVERGPVPSSSADRQRDDILSECPSKFLTIYARRHCAILIFSMVSGMIYYNDMSQIFMKL